MSAYLKREGVDVDATRTTHADLQSKGAEYADLAVDAGLAVAGELPPPFGTAVDVFSIGRSLWKGDWGGALLDTVGLIPGAGAAGKGAKIADRMNTLRKSIDVGTSAVSKAFRGTRKAAGDYWGDIVKRNRKAYDDAIKSCGNNKLCKDKKAALKGDQYKNTPREFDDKGNRKGEWLNADGTPAERGDGVWHPNGGGAPVEYKNGFPDYSGHSVGDVEIPMKGNRTSDFTQADEAMRATHGKNWTRPKNHTWHHHEDGVTMQLVPSNVHATGQGARSPHRGGASLYDSSGNPTPEF